MRYYYEARSFGDRWSPVMAAAKPVTDKSGRIRLANGVGPVVRCVKEIPTALRDADLWGVADAIGTPGIADGRLTHDR